MQQPESIYVHLGALFEKASHPSRARAIADTIRAYLEKENLDDQIEARRLIEQGRKDAR